MSTDNYNFLALKSTTDLYVGRFLSLQSYYTIFLAYFGVFANGAVDKLSTKMANITAKT